MAFQPLTGSLKVLLITTQSLSPGLLRRTAGVSFSPHRQSMAIGPAMVAPLRAKCIALRRTRLTPLIRAPLSARPGAFPMSLVSIETYLPCWYSVFKVHALVACFRSKVLGNYVHDCSRFTVGSDRTIFYPGTLWICQLSSCGPVFSMRPLLTFPLLRNRIRTCRISARLCSTSVFFSCQYFYIKNMQNIRIF